LRFPEDDLLTKLSIQAEELIGNMTPKDLALLAWSLARIKYPEHTPLVNKLNSVVIEILISLSRADIEFYSEKKGEVDEK
jgi:hypothetical protein